MILPYYLHKYLTFLQINYQRLWRNDDCGSLDSHSVDPGFKAQWSHIFLLRLKALYLSHNFFDIKVFNNKFVGLSSPIFRKIYLNMPFLVDNLIINKSLSTTIKNYKQRMLLVP